MEIIGFAAGPLHTNCYVATGITGDGPRGCVIIDPGMGAFDVIKAECEKHGLIPEAVLLTHGHIDHTRDVGKCAKHWDIPVFIHPEDRHMLDNPLIGAGRNLGAMFQVTEMEVPGDIDDLNGDDEVKFAGLAVQVLHAPGHSPGCTMLVATDGGDDVVFSGDVLFASSIGRTDLPGASHEDMMVSLREKVLPLDDGLMILPGHGPTSTIGQEKESNPYLVQVK